MFATLMAAWSASLQQVDVSEPVWIAAWGVGLIAAAVLSRSLGERAQARR